MSFPTTAGQYYSLLMIDPDNYSREKPTYRQFIHWFVINIPGVAGGQGVNVNEGFVVSPYMVSPAAPLLTECKPTYSASHGSISLAAHVLPLPCAVCCSVVVRAALLSLAVAVTATCSCYTSSRRTFLLSTSRSWVNRSCWA